MRLSYRTVSSGVGVSRWTVAREVEELCHDHDHDHDHNDNDNDTRRPTSKQIQQQLFATVQASNYPWRKWWGSIGANNRFTVTTRPVGLA